MIMAIASLTPFVWLTEGRSARDLPKQLPAKKKVLFCLFLVFFSNLITGFHNIFEIEKRLAGFDPQAANHFWFVYDSYSGPVMNF